MSMCEACRILHTLKIDHSEQNTARYHNAHCTKTNYGETNIALKTAWKQPVRAHALVLVLLQNGAEIHPNALYCLHALKIPFIWQICSK